MIIFLVIPGCYCPVSEIIPVDNLTTVEKNVTRDIIADNNSDDEENSEGSGSAGSGETTSDSVTLEVIYQHGTTTSYKNIYVIWLENSSAGFLQNITVCNKLIHGGLTGTALPYWKMNKYPASDTNELNAVTGATKANQDFTVSALIKTSGIKNFTLYVEVDRSFDPNNWFSDQPAILYKSDIDLENSTAEYELAPFGWTPNSDTANIIPGTPAGTLQWDMRYITNYKNGPGFGDSDVSNRATNMVKKITVKVIK